MCFVWDGIRSERQKEKIDTHNKGEREGERERGREGEGKEQGR